MSNEVEDAEGKASAVENEANEAPVDGCQCYATYQALSACSLNRKGASQLHPGFKEENMELQSKVGLLRDISHHCNNKME